jgi:GTP cyclohydrolase I
MAKRNLLGVSFEEQLTRFLTETFGNGNMWDDSAQDTALRWIRAMREFSPKTEMGFKLTTFEAKVNQLIVVCNIEFSSICKHHLFPFVGKAHVGYVPNKKQVGLSKIPRIVHHFATRPQTQETLTSEIASFIKHELEAQGVAVVIEATHTCMSSRGVREVNGVMRTSEMRGVFLTSGEARSEFLSLIGRS